MNNAHQIPWKRILVEATAIVASILLAFAIDAWWQDRAANEAERETIIALLDDFRTSKANIAEWRNFHNSVQNSTKKLLASVVGPHLNLTEPEIALLVVDLSWWDPESHIATGALTSVVFGGDLSSISNSNLRRVLADWPARIEQVESARRQDYDFFLNVWTPYLRANAYLPEMATRYSRMPGREKVISATLDLEVIRSTDYLALVATPEFHNLLVQKYWIQFDILIVFDEIDLRLDETIAMIEEEL